MTTNSNALIVKLPYLSFGIKKQTSRKKRLCQWYFESYSSGRK